MALTLDGATDVILIWLREIAKNTAQTRDAAMGRGTASGAAATREKPDESVFDRFAKRIEAAVGAGINYRLSQAQGLANRGFQGTVEQARYEHSMDQLGRQFAAVMSPILSGFTYAATEIERRFRGLNGRQQDGVMGGIVGAGIGARFGGVPGAVLGFGLGSAYMGGGSSTSAMTGAAAGAYLGFRAGGPIGALFGGVAGGASSAPGSYASERPSDYYERLRADGSSRFGAGASTGLASIAHLFTGGRAGAPPGGVAIGGALGARADAARRDVTPFSADPLAAGGTADLVQKALIRATAGAGAEEDGGPLKPLIDLGIRIVEILIAIATGTGVTVPRSAVDSR